MQVNSADEEKILLWLFGFIKASTLPGQEQIFELSLRGSSRVECMEQSLRRLTKVLIGLWEKGRILTYLLLFFLSLDERELFAFFLRDLFDSGRARRFDFSALAHASSELRSNVRDCSPYPPCKVSCIIAIKSACFWVMSFTIFLCRSVSWFSKDASDI